MALWEFSFITRQLLYCQSELIWHLWITGEQTTLRLSRNPQQWRKHADTCASYSTVFLSSSSHLFACTVTEETIVIQREQIKCRVASQVFHAIRHHTHQFGASPLQLDVKHFKDLPHLLTQHVSLLFHLVWFEFDYPKYLYARSQSNRKQHEQTGLLQQVEENQQRAETTPQNCKQRARGGRRSSQASWTIT